MMEPILRRREDGKLELCAPGVGLWREGPTVGRILQPGERLGGLERLGRTLTLAVPAGAGGAVVERASSARARLPVGYGQVLVVLDPEAAAGIAAAADGAAGVANTGLVLTAPMGGRFYRRPAPGKAPFVEPGDCIEEGHVVGLLEVMKTFNRVHYGGSGLPSPARVTAILRNDDEDVSSGDPLLEVEPEESP